MSDILGHKLPYDSLATLRRAIYAAHPHLQRLGQNAHGDRSLIRSLATLGGTPDKAPFGAAVSDYYFNKPIARASAVMSECSAIAEGRHGLSAAE
jgi:NADH-quinone oxidoreductase subunit G